MLKTDNFFVTWKSSGQYQCHPFKRRKGQYQLSPHKPIWSLKHTVAHIYGLQLMLHICDTFLVPLQSRCKSGAFPTVNQTVVPPAPLLHPCLPRHALGPHCPCLLRPSLLFAHTFSARSFLPSSTHTAKIHHYVDVVHLRSSPAAASPTPPPEEARRWEVDPHGGQSSWGRWT
jgi:hypothetical protein